MNYKVGTDVKRPESRESAYDGAFFFLAGCMLGALVIIAVDQMVAM